uniref:Replication associated protein n=1 Tax=Microviridae sp. ctkQD1 TaxID=2827648 RepID=A0A8S5S4P2_9VIRU|nr:MAG TPA: Replication associated protein [Microviridae sp. ctkQD1]
MACYRPLQAWRLSNGSVTFTERGDCIKTLEIPCGRCIGCRLDRAAQWAARVMHEAKSHKANCFITLTYEKTGPSLNYPDFQKFIRKLRKSTRCKIRYYMCGEYGDINLRPHFHAALFGIDFRQDRYPWKKSDAGMQTYRSPTLENIWTHGQSNIGDLTYESAAYIARYVLKKISGPPAESHYATIDEETGEITHRKAEFTHMSLKPGIGASWFDRYGESDVFRHDRVVTGRHFSKTPKYYDTLLSRTNKNLHEDIKLAREMLQREPGQNTNERLKVREQVALAKSNLKRRTL